MADAWVDLEETVTGDPPVSGLGPVSRWLFHMGALAFYIAAFESNPDEGERARCARLRRLRAELLEVAADIPDIPPSPLPEPHPN